MAIALNFTVPLKQDPQSQAGLPPSGGSFAQAAHPGLYAGRARSQIGHLARTLGIDNTDLPVLTGVDGDPLDYTEFFRKQLGPVFQAIFALAEGAPPWDELNNPNSFYEYTRTLNLPSLGTSTVGNEGRGYLFSAVGDTSVRELQAALRRSDSVPVASSPVEA